MYVAPDLPFDDDDDDDDDYMQTTAPPPNSHEKAPFANSHIYMQSYPHLDRTNWTFLNHGAFGLGLGAGLRRAERWRNFAESQPLRYFDRHLLPHVAHAARGMVDFVTTNEADAARMRGGGTAMIQNVTSGMNAVVGGHHRMGGAGGSSSSVFYYDIAYGSNKKICGHNHGGTGDAIEIPFEEDYLPLLREISTKKKAAGGGGSSSSSTSGGGGGGRGGDWDDDAAEVYISALDSAIGKYLDRGGGGGGGGGGGACKSSSVAGSLLLLDHITSNTAIRLPISSIAKHAKEEHGMIVAVDGAHALWSLPLDVCALLSAGPRGSDDRHGGGGGYVDAYLTNCHKWFSSPRGAALLFCADPEMRETLLSRPAVISHGVDGGFLSRFMYDGCRDYSAQLALPAVLDYWNAIDLVIAREEVRTNLREGVRILCSHWHPDVDASCLYDEDDDSGRNSAEAGLTLVPMGMHAPTMALVRLPDRTSGGGRMGVAGDRANGQHTSSSNSGAEGGDDRKTSTDAKRVQDFLYGRGVEVPVKCVRGVLYVRVSCHMYNTADDFDRLGRVALVLGPMTPPR